MRGLGLLVYTILFTFIFFVDQSAFISMAGAMQGIPAQVDFKLSEIAGDLNYGETVSIPNDFEFYASECFFPGLNEDLSEEGAVLASSSCTNSLGVVCIFYNYYGYVYSACQGILFTPDTNIYDKQEGSRVYTVQRDLDNRVLTLTRAGIQ